jgi:SNF2 family DNA or RNA helicase
LKKYRFKFVDYGQEGHDAVLRFQNDQTPMIFLSQIQSSSGITLTAATYTIYYSLTFDLEHYLQSRDRMYRKGQDKKTTEFHLVMKDSVDELISIALQRKIDVNDALLRQDLKEKLITYLRAR